MTCSRKLWSQKQNCQSEVGVQANWSIPAHVLAICFSCNFCHPFGAFKVLLVMAQAEEDYRMLRPFSSRSELFAYTNAMLHCRMWYLCWVCCSHKVKSVHDDTGTLEIAQNHCQLRSMIHPVQSLSHWSVISIFLMNFLLEFFGSAWRSFWGNSPKKNWRSRLILPTLQI
jgi:hypothetical protein